MILTYKIRHDRDFSVELLKARKVAEYAIANRDKLSSKNVKHLGLKSAIANQVLRKYGNDQKAQRITSVNLIVPGQGVKYDFETKQICIPCLSLALDGSNLRPFSKINQVELNAEYAFVSIAVQEMDETKPQSWVGVDLNATGHCVVVGNPDTGKILKLGKQAHHVHIKYKSTRNRLQRKGVWKKLKAIKRRESKIVRDLNHKISRCVVEFARANNAGIVLEDLKGIRKTRKQAKSFRYSLHSWSFAQLRSFIEYKAKGIM